MGKAIVINDLVVSNPLTTVTFLSTESILSKYYTANSTINADEKAALETFIEGILDAGLWRKILYFYPMLGSTVTDQILEVVDTDMEDLFNTNLSGTLSTTGLSVVNRTLRSLNRSMSIGTDYPVINTTRIKSLSFSNMGIVSAMNYMGTTAADTPMGGTLRFMYGQLISNCIATGLNYASSSSNYRYPEMYASGKSENVVYPTGSSDGGNNLSYAERILYADYNDTVATLYKDKTLYKTGVNSAVTDSTNGYRLNSLLSNISEYNADNGFLAITEHLTEGEWGTFYDILLPFLKAVGKHS